MGLLDYISQKAKAIPDNAKAAYRGLLAAPEELAALFSPGMLKGVNQAMNTPATLDRDKALGMAMDYLQTTPAGLLGHIVYHGSPHKFNKFDMSKIGTGEGAQAYGHGLYFAESPEVAKSYAEDGAIKYGDLLKIGKHEIPRDDWRFEAAVAAKRAIDEGEGLPRYFTPKQEKWAEAVRSRGLDVEIAEPNLYKVDIPDEAIPRMLDWDKPFANADDMERFAAQFDTVDPATRKMLEDWGYENAQRGMPMPDGQEIVSRLGGIENSNARRATEMMRQAGIPGIRYLDGNSRGAGQGTSNFVLFDDQLPRILEVNGQPTGLLSYADEAAKKKRK